MTTSGVIDTDLTVRDVVSLALQELGVVDTVTDMDPGDAEKARVRLFLMLKSWQADGNHLWLREDFSITWPADTQTEPLDPRVMDVLSLRWEENGSQTPIRRYAREEWNRLPVKGTTGTPFIFLFNRQRAVSYLSLYPIPTEELELVGECVRIIEDVTDLNETLDIPQEWLETVYKGLAVRCANLFGKSGSPRVTQIAAEAQDLFQRLTGLDREPVVTFRPSRRYYRR